MCIHTSLIFVNVCVGRLRKTQEGEEFHFGMREYDYVNIHAVKATENHTKKTEGDGMAILLLVEVVSGCMSILQTHIARQMGTKTNQRIRLCYPHRRR